MARSNPSLEVTGIDFSSASLRIATQLAGQHGIRCNFRQHSLLDPIDNLGKFTLISSIGVLHSLQHPQVGLRHLRQVIHPHGRFLGMVYGSFGKWKLFQARDALKLLCGAGASRTESLEVLKDCDFLTNTGLFHYFSLLRKRLRFGPSIEPIEALKRVINGRNLAYQADSYTHVREETYSWDELVALLEQTGWRFLGWPKRSGMPDSPKQIFSGRALALVSGKTQQELAGIYERVVKPENLYFLAEPA